MKKILITMFAMLALGSTVYGDELKVENVTMSQTGKSALLVYFNQSQKSTISGLDFKIKLPAGVEFVKDGENPVCYTASTFSGHATPNILQDGTLSVPMASDNPIKGSKGLVFAVQIQPSSTLSPGTLDELGTVFDVTETPDGENIYDLASSTFNVTVKDCDVVLDENSPFAPETTESNVKIFVKRTITGGQWSTICLPFQIKSDNLEAIFGKGVQLAEFKSYSSDDNFQTMSVNFDIATGNLSTNKVYLIKTSETIEQFKITAKITKNTAAKVSYSVYDEDEEEDVEKGYFQGTYVADAYVPKNDLFISDNIFYYSIGTTRIKAFRGYFHFKDKLNISAGTRAFISVDGDGTTGLQKINFTKSENGKIYSLTGKYMGEKETLKSLPKGIYIVDGIKVVNK